ncbi:VOC family protein [Sphingomonas naphthae]|uniref:VOC family protein n=1 Tax=Sphingomonas naphthae TaxID=1813468 RepID=A0ABY7TK93_9SPHN|nr:VOC family protein [Sphingomonas naphthae]WCT73653.1 VOC family protein [Sphingomonas naphthae]
MGAPARLLVNIDVPNVAAGEAFYAGLFGLTAGRRFGDTVVELLGLEAPLYLIARPAGPRDEAYGSVARDYGRHWTPVHLDVAVEDIEAASARAVALGAIAEGGVREAGYGRIATFADPFGHGFCLIQFTPEGYDAVAD